MATLKIQSAKIELFQATPKISIFLGWDFSTFFLLIWFKSTKMKFRPYYTMELIKKIMKKTSKYLIYSPLTEKVLTEWPCSLRKRNSSRKVCNQLTWFHLSYYSSLCELILWRIIINASSVFSWCFASKCSKQLHCQGYKRFV